MRLLLTSSGVTNPSIEAALVDMLGKPIADARALCVPTGIYPFDGGADMAARLIRGQAPGGALCDLGWKSLGILELTALPSVDHEVWSAAVRETDALLVWGGDPLYLSHWMWQSGLAELLPTLRPETVYLGVSAGAMAATSIFGENYSDPPKAAGTPLTSEDIMFGSPDGDVRRTFVTARGAGLVDIAVIPHFDHPDHTGAARDNAAIWAAKLPVPTYAIDDHSAVSVVDGKIDIVSEGDWKLFTPETA